MSDWTKDPKGYVCGYCGQWFQKLKVLAGHPCPQEAQRKAQINGATKL